MQMTTITCPWFQRTVTAFIGIETALAWIVVAGTESLFDGRKITETLVKTEICGRKVYLDTT